MAHSLEIKSKQHKVSSGEALMARPSWQMDYNGSSSYEKERDHMTRLENRVKGGDRLTVFLTTLSEKVTQGTHKNYINLFQE